MSLAGEIDLYGIWFEMQGYLLLKCKVGRPKVEGFHTWCLLNCQRAFTSEICTDHHRGGTDGKVSALMVWMIVSVHDELHGQWRDSPDRVEQFGSFGLIEPSIDHENSCVTYEKGAIGAGIVIGNVCVQRRPDLLDR